MRADALTSTVSAVPGTTVQCRVRVVNESTGPAALSIRVYGLADDDERPVPGPPVPPGESLDLVVPLVIPPAFADGEHTLAVEIRSDRSDDVPAVAPLTLRISSLDKVLVRITPDVMRGRRRQRFAVDIENHRDETVDIAMRGSGTALDVSLSDEQITLMRGEHIRLGGRLRGPRHLSGDPLQHVLTVEGRGATAPSYATASVTQRPLFATRLRGLMAGLALLALWLGAVGGAVYWWNERGKRSTEVEATQTTLAGGTQTTTATGGTGDGSSTGNGTGDGTGDGSSSGGGTGGGDEAAGDLPEGPPTETIVRGSVKAGATGSNDNVAVTLTSLIPDESTAVTLTADSSATPPASSGFGTLARPPSSAGSSAAPAASATGSDSSGLPDGSADTAKYWGARAGGYTGGDRLHGPVATLTVQSTNSKIDGTYQFDNVRLRRGYVISFSKAGFDTQTFQIDPPDDGKTVELDVELQPSKGSIGGKVTEAGGGPLGDVALTITDGTLTFNTTSSTLASEAGGIGGWKVDGISTPSTYTVVASRTGYGTQVQQVTLGLGETPGNVNFVMVKGVGSIGGTVSGPNGPMGGVTLTASDGTITRTTNSFTTGTPGGFLFPGLPVPGNYTITASADGVATETQVVTLTKENPNVTGVEFRLKSTFAAITGIVYSVGSSGRHVPLPNAAVELRLGELKIRTTTATSGGFTLSSLPPGTYTITVSRYDHSTESRSITLVAGVPQDLPEFLLTYTPRQQLKATGSLDVTLMKNLNGAQSPLDQVTLTLKDIAGRITIPNPPAASVNGSYLYSEVPIGTYTLLADRAGYRPQSIARITIGTDRVPMPIIMLRFGQAFGQVVDALSAEPLDGYELLLYQDNHPGLQCKKVITIGNQAPVGGKIQWDVDTSVQLLNGDYVLRFRPATGDTSSPCSTGGRLPAGFADRPDANGNVGTFQVTDNDDPIDLHDLPVYPYPIVRGLVLAPQFANSTITYLGLDDLTAADLAVTLDCHTGRTVGAALTRQGNVASYTFGRAAVASLFATGPAPADGVLSLCSVTATATGYRDVHVEMTPALAIPVAAPYLDRIANLALVDFPDRLNGTVYWTDPFDGTPIFVGGAHVDGPNAIVAFGAGEAPDPDGTVPGPTGNDPTTTTANLQAVSATGSGTWEFPEPSQVFGTTTYTFTDPTIQQAAFDLTIDQTQRTFSNETGMEPIVDDGSIDVVVKPQPGSLDGNVTIITTRSAQPFGDAVISATAPSAPRPVTDHAVDGTGHYSFTGEAGTWFLGLSTTPTGNLVPAFGDTGAGVRIPAGGSVTAPARTFVELGQVVTNFRDNADPDPATNPIPQYTVSGVNYPRVELTMQPGPVPYPAWDPLAAHNAEVQAGAPGIATARLLPVSQQVLPTATPVAYQLHFEMPGFDLAHSNWTVFDEAGTALASGSGSSPDQVVQILPGTRLRVEISADRYGTISGTVRGLDDPANVVPGTNTRDLDLDDGLTVTMKRLPDGQTDCSLAIDEGTVVTRTAGPPPGFTAGVRAGSYCVTYSHPDYVGITRTVTVAPSGTTDASTDLNVAAGGFRLSLETDETSHSPVDGALVRLFADGTPINTLDTATVIRSATSAGGEVFFDPATNNGLIPGRYLVAVTRRATPAGPDLNFPVIATVDIPRGGGTLTKRALMPLTGFSLAGVVTAENIDHRPLTLPPFTVTRSYTTPQATGSDGLPNNATDANQQRLTDQTTRDFPAPTTTSQGYSFDELAVGAHVVHFTSGAPYGFDAPGDVPVTVDGVPEPDGSFQPEAAGITTYTASSVTVRVRLLGLAGNGPHTGIGVSLDIPYGTSPNIPGTEDPAAPGTWVFNVVQPDLSDYTIVVTAPSYNVTAADTVLPVRPSTAPVTHDVHLAAFATLSGTATKQLTATTSGPVTETDSVELLDSTGTVLQRATPSASGAYTFVVNSVQTLRVRAVVDNFITTTVNVPAYSLGGANPVAVPAITIDQYASATVTVSGGAAATASVTASPSTGVQITQPSTGVFQVAHLVPNTNYTLTVSAPNYLDQTYPSTGTFAPAIGSNQPVAITLEAPKSISGTTRSGTTGVQSRVTLLKGANVVAGPVDTAADGSYSFTGLGYGSYTVRASAVGVGGGLLSGINVNANQPAPTAQDVTLTARSLTVHFNVAPAAAVPTITVNNAVGTSGQVTFTFPETGNLSYSVAAPGYLTTTAPLTVVIPIDWNGTDTVQVTPPALVEVAVEGTVTGASANFPARVYLCAGNVTTAAACATSARFVGVTASGGSFSFSPVVANSYNLVAARGTTYTALVPITVTDTGVSPTTISLTFS